LRQLTDPLELPNMPQAIERLVLARERGERLVLFGDYDVDGVTSVAVLLEVLGCLGWAVEVYLPQRFEEGYGLSEGAVRTCLERFPATLLVAVDCGSTAGATVARLAASGVDVVILDHHQVSSPAPAATALVNPQLWGASTHPARELCSVGLAFKLAHALVKEGRQRGWPAALGFDVRSLLDLVALGTVADLVPIIDENRILVSAGLERIATSPRPGLVALREVAGVRGAVGTFEVGFQLGPRLNAAGRLDTATAALDLLRAGTRDAAPP
jgi:single-stranded-DNA-specific exonuclease